MNKFCIHSKNLEDTYSIAAIIAPVFQLGDAIILEGDLGAGKTYFTKAFAEALGATENVTSPTYAITNFHPISLGNLMHIDAYRLSGLDEFIDLGLDEYFDESITFAEWGKKILAAFPAYLFIQIKLSKSEEERLIIFSYHGERWKNDFENLKDKLADFNVNSDW